MKKNSSRHKAAVNPLTLSFISFISLIGLWVSCCFSCLPLLDWRSSEVIDYFPPVLQHWSVEGNNKVRFQFDEEVVCNPERLVFSTEFKAKILVSETKDGFDLVLDHQMKAGWLYQVALEVNDAAHNSLQLMVDFYGFNPNPPQLLINEVRLEGSSTRPDLIEFVAVTGGNLAGLAFYRGSDQDYDFRFIFPSLEVKQGDFILLHVKPSGDILEVSELHNQQESGGIEASNSAWDFWLSEAEGLSATNGLLLVTQSPGGEWMDAFLYSNRTSLSDEKYSGFGNFTNLSRATLAFEKGAWIGAGDKITPEDCFYPVDGTSTRTLCRHSNSEDHQNKDDWHIVPTGGFSFGEVNSDEKYLP